MDEQPRRGAGGPGGPISSDSLSGPVVPAPYFSQRNVESGYSRHSRGPLGWHASPPPPPVAHLLKTLLVGKKEKSGFVRNISNLQNLGQSYDHPQRFLTFYNSDFCNGGFLSQKRPELRGCEMSLLESGFTRGTRSSLSHTPGVSLEAQPSAPKAGSVPVGQGVGRKERSGFVNNMPNFQKLGSNLQDPERFLTHYQSTFCNVAGFQMNG
ncbi:hypothetical protein COCON_G00212940 [Conger conger]|uniref:Uncharacterized protein n=1 Tax=Conger conger TaxID=82655 RepID=A0A9Q1CX08_CONCO|nr:uncharacterized protein saxo4 [Conger conger]KAJ8251982.1 hypothetical protein COCON_G00212940 [Conger conger]